jgi:diguanylate cyclase (GGDEF)-like protein
MENDKLHMLDMLSLIYEDMDIDAIEERFVAFVAEIFAFDRVGLFFVKHRKGVLQGKLCKGFADGTISSINIPIAEEYLFTRPLITGFPVLGSGHEDDPFAKKLELNNFAVIPIVNRKRISCWKIKKCQATDCPVYGSKLLRCWLVANTRCCDAEGRSSLDKLRLCEMCPVFSSRDSNSVEGVLLVDNSMSGHAIDPKTVTLLSIVAHSIGIAVNNAKSYSNVLRDSIHDDLTGLYNRRYFNERLMEEVERAHRYGDNFSLLMVDIDNFKQVNDDYGHPAGDKVLAAVGGALGAQLRKTDVVARYGGEEFVIILFNAQKGKAVEIAENLRVAVAAFALSGAEEIQVTVSIGVATFGIDANSFEGLIRTADKALYNAKSRGRNQVCTT